MSLSPHPALSSPSPSSSASPFPASSTAGQARLQGGHSRASRAARWAQRGWPSTAAPRASSCLPGLAASPRCFPPAAVPAWRGPSSCRPPAAQATIWGTIAPKLLVEVFLCTHGLWLKMSFNRARCWYLRSIKMAGGITLGPNFYKGWQQWVRRCPTVLWGPGRVTLPQASSDPSSIGGHRATALSCSCTLESSR